MTTEFDYDKELDDDTDYDDPHDHSNNNSNHNNQYDCGTTYAESEHYYYDSKTYDNCTGIDVSSGNRTNAPPPPPSAAAAAEEEEEDEEEVPHQQETNSSTYYDEDCDNDYTTTTPSDLLSAIFLEDATSTTPSSSSSLLTIESLRDKIASDVIIDHNNNHDTNTTSPYTMFASPFERNTKYSNSKVKNPGTSSSSNNNHADGINDGNNNNNNNKYYSVPLIYCDQTASNRPLRSIEQYIDTHCLPYYGNTHTNTSMTGKQCTAYIAEARQLVAEMTNAKITGKASTDIVLFTGGNGATSAIELFIDCLNIKEICRSYQSSSTVQQQQQPIVFVGPYEHHSNLIPWRETGCQIIMIPENPQTQMIDYIVLEQYLQFYCTTTTTTTTSSSQQQQQQRLMIGTFTAASNVTGKLCNVEKLTYILHKYKALAIFDYATASSYVTKMDMNPTSSSNNNDNTEYPDKSISLAKDAIFISPHKMIGGSCSTPGILIIKKHLVSQVNAPNRSGGGTVFYVTHTSHRFLSHRIHRYEGGTPNIIGIIRIGLIFLLKRQIDDQYNQCKERLLLQQQQQQQQQKEDNNTSNGITKFVVPKSIQEYDIATYTYVAQYLKDHAPNLILLGYNYNNNINQDIKDTEQSLYRNQSSNQHLPIFSFLIRFQKRFLHYNFVCALLNDIFGIQSRGGCQCSGPYSQQLLGLVEVISRTSHFDSNNNENTHTKSEGDITHHDIVPNTANQEIEQALYRYKERAELLRPGYTRLSLPFKGVRTIEMRYVLKALVWISKYGWALMCQYRCNHRTGEWRHKSRQGKPFGRNDERKWLSHYSMFDSTSSNNSDSSNRLTAHEQNESKDHSHTTAMCQKILDATFMNAEEILASAKADQRSIVEASKMVDADSILGNDDDEGKLEKLRWYVYPKECADLLLHGVDPNEASSTNDKPNVTTILGAIQPTSICALKSSSDSEYINHRKRKQQSSINHVIITDPFESTDISSTPGVMTENESNQVSEIDISKKKGVRTSLNWGSRLDVPLKDLKVAETSQHENMAKGESDISASISIPTVLNPKKQKFRHVKPPPKLMRTATQAIVQWDMINEGDRLLLGLSGGKDSLSLLHVLLELKRIRPIKFELEVCTVDPMTPSFDPSPLIPYVESLGLKYHYIRDDIVSRATNSGKSGTMVSSLCAYCARMKRGNLYSCARRNNCNKLVLAQHLDDCAESMMMSMMHNGFLRTMKANYSIDAGDLSVIRPLIYCREGMMTSFAKDANLPVINENCPACFEEPKERARIKKMLSREETLYPTFYDNIRRSLIPLMHDDMAAILRAFTEETIARSRKIPWKDRSGSLEHKPSFNSTSKEEKFSNQSSSIAHISDDALILELARRKAMKLKSTTNGSEANGTSSSESLVPDLTGQVCTLNGGNGTIPCYELME